MCAPLGTAPAVAGEEEKTPEVADIFRAHGEPYRRTHRLAKVQDQAMRAIASCRTPALGGHRWLCDGCGEVRVLYNSCRNRHCPKCQSLDQARWAEDRLAELLPVEYFHTGFTLPHALNPLAQGNPRVVYDLLFRSASQTLLEFGRDPKHLGGAIGFTAILHTWGQDLSQHIHLHCLVPGGALSPGGSRFLFARPRWLFPVKALSKTFRGKFLDGLRQAYKEGKLKFADGTAELAEPQAFAALLETLKEHPWVVYVKESFSSPKPILAYLARYTQRVAISNDRIVSFKNGFVRFRWKDYADGGKTKVMPLPAEEFIRRFLLHVLPSGFVRIRHYGFLANRHRRTKLDRCLLLLFQPPFEPPAVPESAAEMIFRLTGRDIALCPACGKCRMRVVETLPPIPAPSFLPPACDTS